MKKRIIKIGEYFFVLRRSESDSREWEFASEVTFPTLEAAKSFIDAYNYCYYNKRDVKLEIIYDELKSPYE